VPPVVSTSIPTTAHMIANRSPIACPPMIAACIFLVASFQPARTTLDGAKYAPGG
jgi:hypothetical protein